MVFCTLSNKKYLLQGIALAYSLHQHSKKNYKLYYLCLDEISYTTLITLSESYDFNIIPIKAESIEKHYPELLQLKNSNFSEYCFSFSSLLPLYIFTTYNDPSVLYLDSDVYFYNSPELIYEEIGDKEVGIIRHRHIGREHFAGEYNVNCVYFKNSVPAKKVLNWWYNAYKTKTPPELSTCGDQKYLEGFETVIPDTDIAIIDDLVGHAAPWNYKLYKFSNNPKTITWEGKSQLFVFNHFSKFGFNFENDYYSPTQNEYWGDLHNGKILDIPFVFDLHLNYYNILKTLNNQLGLNLNSNMI